MPVTPILMRVRDDKACTGYSPHQVRSIVIKHYLSALHYGFNKSLFISLIAA
jgi:hypothetical protein